MTFFETHRHIEHIVFDIFSYKTYVFYVFQKNVIQGIFINKKHLLY